MPSPMINKAPDSRTDRGLVNGGAEGIRTPDLRRAKAALSQLSYGPSIACRLPESRAVGRWRVPAYHQSPHAWAATPESAWTHSPKSSALALRAKDSSHASSSA